MTSEGSARTPSRPPNTPGNDEGRTATARRRTAIGRMALSAAVVTVGIVLIVAVGIDRPRDGQRDTEDEAFPVPLLRPEPNSAIPASGIEAPEDRPHAADIDQLTEWSQRVEAVTKIPARTLRAYGLAEMWMRSEAPDCRLPWTVLAGIGRVESRHGTLDGADVDENGVSTTSIIGPVLDGTGGNRKVRDTDDGELDEDPQWDRAVGPMQFIPETWSKYRVRAARDGLDPDPHNVDDAAVTAARLLCGRGKNLASKKGWWRAVLAYNQSVTYAQDVFSGAQAYAKASKELSEAEG